jgi:8-amino-7-oxononanoate synthase
MSAATERLNELWKTQARSLAAKHLARKPYIPPCDVLDFSSSDYLGVRTDARLAEGASEWAHRYGSGAGASRLVVQFCDKLDSLESRFAELTGWESAVLFASGFMANIGLFEALSQVERGQTEFFLDHRAHSSLYTATRLSGIPTQLYRHGDFTHLAHKLSTSSAIHKMIIVESLHSMDGTFENAEALVQICEAYGAVLIVDEAHSAAICGPQGAGWLACYPELRKHAIAVMFGCGKALGVMGGFVCCSKELQAMLFQSARSLIFTTGVAPAVAGSLWASVEVLFSEEGNQRRQQLYTHIHRVREDISKWEGLGQKFSLCGSPESPILGIVVQSEEKALQLSEVLLKRKLLVRPIRPPTVPKGTSRLRIILHSTHTKEQLFSLSQELKVALHDL